MIRVGFIALIVPTVALAACNSPDSGRDEIARESAERNAAIAAAMNHPALTGNDSSSAGKPLPPLPGVNAPAPKPPPDQQHERNHH